MKSDIVFLGTAAAQDLRETLRNRYNLIVVNSVSGALTAVRKGGISAVLVDHANSLSHKLEAIHELKAAYPDLNIISIGTPKSCQTQNALGFSNWIHYPVDRDDLLRKLRQTSRFVPKSCAESNYRSMVGSSPAIMKVFRSIAKIADVECSVLICGEHGTGKELVARRLHFESSRRNHPFVTVSCGALAPTLLESELFGHERGAFTGAYNTKRGRFERAGRGTIFLDEIADIVPPLQAKLLRVLQEREFEKVGGNGVQKMYARVIAATNKNLEAEVREGTFREDLYYRLNVVNRFLAPLRCRKEDIPLLVSYFVKKYGKTCGRNGVSVSDETMEILKKYAWPGNVRELEHQIWRAICLSEDNIISPEDISLGLRGALVERRRVSINKEVGRLSRPEAVESVERRMIYDALKKANHVKARAARFLGITERMLSYKINKYDIELKR